MSPVHPMPLHLQGGEASRQFKRRQRGSGAGQRTLGLSPPHEAGQRAAKRLLVELSRATRALQELRRGVATVDSEGGVGPNAAEPLCYPEAAIEAGVVQWCTPPDVSGVDRGTHAEQPVSDGEVAPRAGAVQRCVSHVAGCVDRGSCTLQPLRDFEVALCAGEVQWCLSLDVSGVDRGAHAVQPLSDVEVTGNAGGM